MGGQAHVLIPILLVIEFWDDFAKSFKRPNPEARDTVGANITEAAETYVTGRAVYIIGNIADKKKKATELKEALLIMDKYKGCDEHLEDALRTNIAKHTKV